MLQQASVAAESGRLEDSTRLIVRAMEGASGKQGSSETLAPAVAVPEIISPRPAAALEKPQDRPLSPVPPSPGKGPTMGERISRLCSDPGYISFDCVESPAIALLNIAADNRTRNPAVYWSVGAVGMILGAVLFIPALVISVASGMVNLIGDLTRG